MMAFLLALFVLCALVIAIAGGRLIVAADAIAHRLRLGRAFLGMILVATITSLPEASTGVSAVAIAHAPDIAVGDIVGSCVFNLLLFTLADAASRKVAFYGRLSPAHNLTAAFGIILLGALAIALLAPATARIALGHVGVHSILLGLLYLGAARLLYAVNVQATPTSEEPHIGLSLRSALARCALAGGAVIVAGALLAVVADRIGAEAHLSDSLVGALFVAASTSLPEVVTTLAAVRLRAYDLAAGSLLGSNLFNMVVLVVDDVAYVDGPILAYASDALAATAVVAMVMTGIVVAALNSVRRTEPHAVDVWAGFSMAALYLLNAWLLLGAGATSS